MTWTPAKWDEDIFFGDPDSNHSFCVEFLGAGKWTATHTRKSPDYSHIRLGKTFASFDEASAMCSLVYQSLK